MTTYYSQFKHVGVGSVFECSGTMYTKINGRMAQITEPEQAYNGKKFYFAMTELCKMFC